MRTLPKELCAIKPEYSHLGVYSEGGLPELLDSPENSDDPRLKRVGKLFAQQRRERKTI